MQLLVGNAPCSWGVEFASDRRNPPWRSEGPFCRLGEEIVGFAAFRQALADRGYSGWATVEQDCDPAEPTSPFDDARANIRYLTPVGFA